MAGLGSVNNERGTFLTITGGYIWNRKADESDPNYGTQAYENRDGTKNVRSGAQYAFFEGNVVGVEFKTHEEYGENINVTLEAEGDRYIVSISTNNRYSQDMMKALLKMDLEKEVHFKPYDFTGSDGRRAHGIVFRQDGEKIVLFNEDAPSKDSDWFKSADKKNIRRFFEDLTEWFIAEIKENVCSKFSKEVKTEEKKVEKVEEKKEEKVEKVEEKKEEKEILKVTPLKMRKILKEFIAENYEGKELPKLSKDELVVWYNLSQDMEELPWPKENKEAEVSKTDLDDQLSKLI
jgi:hypothetical protein